MSAPPAIRPATGLRLVVAAAMSVAVALAALARGDERGCEGLAAGGSAAASTARTEDCMACHGAGGRGTTLSHGHPTDVDYRRSSASRPGSFRAYEEVVRRGVFLPDGQLRCVTCHDPRSTFPFHFALPAGSRPSPEDPRDATPLCLQCHAF
jgi:hypothetical protein